MKRILLWVLAMALAGIIVGCGGGNSPGPNPGDPGVTIKDFAFLPHNLTVKPGTKVVWSNAGSTTHSVLSGTLQSFAFTQVVPVTLLDTGFVSGNTNPQIIDGVLTVRLGDIVRFTNQSQTPSQIEVKDKFTLKQIFITPLLTNFRSADYNTIVGGAGDFLVKDSSAQAFTFELLVVGRPNPDRNPVLDSGPIQPGQSFEHTFTSADSGKTFSYFCSIHNIEHGTITVE